MTIAPEATTDNRRRQIKFALISLFNGGLVIGFSPIFVRLSELDAVSTAVWRLALALVPLLVMVARSKPEANQKPKGLREFWTRAPLGIVLGIEPAAWHSSLHMTSVVNSALLVNRGPILVTL